MTYNAKGQIATDNTVTKRAKSGGGFDTIVANTTNNYGTGTGYALGSVVSATTATTTNGGTAVNSSLANTYLWRDGAMAATVVNTPNTSQSSTWTSNYSYNRRNELLSVYIQDGRPRDVDFVTDLNGQVIRRDEDQGSTNPGPDPHERTYRFGGKEMGVVSNNGTFETDHHTSIGDRQALQGTGPFRNGSTQSVSYADFDRSYQPLTSYHQGSATGTYTVRGGESLATIAAGLWGDAAAAAAAFSA